MQVPEGVEGLLGEHAVRLRGALQQQARKLIVCDRAKACDNIRGIIGGRGHGEKNDDMEERPTSFTKLCEGGH